MRPRDAGVTGGPVVGRQLESLGQSAADVDDIRGCVLTAASGETAEAQVSLRSFDENGTAFLYSGTSFSAPFVSGAVALLAQAFPNLTGWMARVRARPQVQAALHAEGLLKA